MSGLPRNFETKIDKLLEYFPVVVIIGSRQCGKTTLAKRVRPNWKYYDLEKASDYDFITSDYDFFFRENNEAVIIDEAQNSEHLFNELRSVIDADRNRKNRFILTGSSSFELFKNVSESLAGRVAIVELGTLKANEFYEQSLSGFYKIFESKITEDSISNLLILKNAIGSKEMRMFYLRGGYPEPVLSNSDEFYDTWMEQYFQTYINRDIRKLFPKLNLVNYRRFVSMLSQLSGTLINKAEIARSVDTSEVTVREYMEIAHYSFVWRNVFSYEKTQSKSIVKMPKGVFRDSGMLHYLKNVKTLDELDRNPYVGIDFESFVIEEIIKGLNSTMVTNWDYFYYRTKNGAEVDLILEGNFGVLPIEIKYGMNTKLNQLTSLNKFVKDNDCPFGIVINNSDEVKKISDRIIQMPVGLI